MAVLASFQFIECGTHLDKPWFNWEGGIVPYYFNVSVTNDDRVMMRHMMKQIEKKSCIRFKEQTNQPSGLTYVYIMYKAYVNISIIQSHQVITLRSRFIVGLPVSSLANPDSVQLCMQSPPGTRRSSSTVPTSWQTGESAGLRTGGASCMRCFTCLGSCTLR